MRRRGTRIILLLLLLGAAVPAGYVIWSADQRLRQFDTERRATESTLDRLLSSIHRVRAIQLTYAADGRADLGSLTRVSLLVDQLTTDAAGLRATEPNGPAASPLEEFWTALSSLMSAERQARAHLAAADAGAASSLLLDSARAHVAALESALRAFREAEQDAIRAASDATRWRWQAAILAIGVLWAVGLAAFAVRRPATPSPVTPIDAPARRETPQVAAPVDLQAVASLASDVSRLDDSAQLPALLGRACEALRARGAIVWLDSGDALHPAVTHGYDSSVLRLIVPITRTEENATAAAWRLGTLQIVPADGTGYGAIVAPLLRPSACAGALAIEVPGGDEDEPGTQAVAILLAAQFSSVLAPVKGVSTVSSDRLLHRDAAAS